ncbi:hypothetical protein BpHYR1_050647 [Brachionus plicatilis]|uniref:Uncharacterized protein n=1 Tax=Brachionus plicatilis TaxID=10195 RepID=A0A3M7QLW0_BRAPC|nr:hypothetical protein BpHYR1_050647 [Brachionus plicatilis]
MIYSKGPLSTESTIFNFTSKCDFDIFFIISNGGDLITDFEIILKKKTLFKNFELTVLNFTRIISKS